jgi:hypothetical protein
MGSYEEAKYEYGCAQTLIGGRFEASVEGRALDLVDEFRSRRGKLQADEQNRVNAEALANFQRPYKVWCPLNLFTRMNSGSLELSWQMVNYSKVKKVPLYWQIKKGDEHYDLRALLGKAKPFERDLIREIELRAREIREAWWQLSRIRILVRGLTG